MFFFDGGCGCWWGGRFFLGEDAHVCGGAEVVDVELGGWGMGVWLFVRSDSVLKKRSDGSRMGLDGLFLFV